MVCLSSSFRCGIFVDLQKTFGTVDQKILQQKLNYYGIRGICQARRNRGGGAAAPPDFC